jgi:membrane associated rhomboid family serine protease
MAAPPERSLLTAVKTQAAVLIALVLLLWLVHLLNVAIFSGQLLNYGIMPGRLVGLRGILFAPLLHGSFAHLLANTLSLVVLGWLTLLGGQRDFWLTTTVVMLTAGLGTWLLGAPNSIHIGASGLIFGYFGRLLLRGYFARSFGAVALSLLVGVMYGSLLWGVLPSSLGISWQSHLFGFLGGAIAARLLAARPPAAG